MPSLVASARDAQTHQLVPGIFEISNTDDGTRYSHQWVEGKASPALLIESCARAPN